VVVRAVLAGMAAAVGVLVLLAPASGIDRQPPECYAVFGYVVPCGNGWAGGAAVAAGLLLGGLVWWLGRHSRPGT
jgi:hypothetical protein